MHPLWKKGKTLKGQSRGLRPVFTLPPALDFVPTAGHNAGHQRRARTAARDKPCMRDMLIARPLHAFVRRRSLLGSTFREHGVNWRLERDEQNARAGVSAARLVLGFGRAICV